jgi:hypothetical protein
MGSSLPSFAASILLVSFWAMQARALEVPFGSQTPITITSSATGAQSVFAAYIDGDGDVAALSGYSSSIAWYANMAGKGSTWTPRLPQPRG